MLCSTLAKQLRPCAAAQPFSFARWLAWPSVGAGGTSNLMRGVYWRPVNSTTRATDTNFGTSNSVLENWQATASNADEAIAGQPFPAGMVGCAWWTVRAYWPTDEKDGQSALGNPWPLPMLRYSLLQNGVAVPGYAAQLVTTLPSAVAFSATSGKARDTYAESDPGSFTPEDTANPWNARYELTEPLCPIWLRAGDRVALWLHDPPNITTEVALSALVNFPVLQVVQGWAWPESEDHACDC